MVRTQIQLTEAQTALLKQLAQQQHLSMAELIRQSIDSYLGQIGTVSVAQQYENALVVAGKYATGDVDLSEAHDAYLAEAYGG